MTKNRAILDTNILVSYLLKPNPTIKTCVDYILQNCTILISQDTFDELRNVAERFVKKNYITTTESSEFLASIIEVAEWIKILEKVKGRRDLNDNRFLELAVNGNADYLITGDKDLLILNPFKGIKIISAKEYIDNFIN